MSLVRNFISGMFRDSFLGVFGPQYVTANVSALASGAFAKQSGIAVPGLQPGDIVFAQLVAPASGVVLEGQCTAAGALELVWYNISGSAYTNTTGQVFVIALRPRVA